MITGPDGAILRVLITLSLALTLSAAAPPAPAIAQDVEPGQILARVCLPYAMRAASFEKAISLARDLQFRRPRGSEPLEEWASDVELVSRDGAWRIKLEEGTITDGDTDVYAVSCSLSSPRANIRTLSNLIDRALSNDPRWNRGDAVRWAHARPSEDTALVIDIKEHQDRHPVLSATGLYR